MCYTAPVLTLLLAACQSDSDLHHVRGEPEVAITAPAEGAVLRLGEGPFSAEGTALDAFTPAADLALTWTLDGADTAGVPTADGQTSWEMPLSEADLGPHELTLTATDSDGDQGTATVAFTLLGPREAPVVTITTPDDGAAFGTADTIVFTGTAADSVSGPESLTFAWTAGGVALPGAISADGQSVVLAALPAGETVVTLQVTDEDGDVGEDQVTVVVSDVPIVAEPGDLVFSEMMVDPQVVEDELGEWVELYNTSGHTIDIGGYSFHDDDVDAYVLTGEILVAAHDYVVLCADVDASVNGGIPCDAGFVRHAGGGGLAIANGEDELVLSRPDGTEIDWLHYDDTWYDPGFAIGVDPDFQTSGDNDAAAHWCAQTSVVTSGGEPATPGLPNDECGDL